MFFTGGFNAQFWWPEGDTTDDGTDIDEFFCRFISSYIWANKLEPPLILIVITK